MKNMRNKVLQIVENSRGDNLYRAQMAFRGKSSMQMEEQYGESGKTCSEILNEYKLHNAIIDDCIEWIKGVE